MDPGSSDSEELCVYLKDFSKDATYAIPYPSNFNASNVSQTMKQCQIKARKIFPNQQSFIMFYDSQKVNN